MPGAHANLDENGKFLVWYEPQINHAVCAIAVNLASTSPRMFGVRAETGDVLAYDTSHVVNHLHCHMNCSV